MFVINTCNNSSENHGKKCVSVKVLINKEESRVCWEFLKCGENKNWE